MDELKRGKKLISDNLLNAYAELQKRAFSNLEKDIVIEDEKFKVDSELPAEGIMQDCEFGMIMIATRKFLIDNNFLKPTKSETEKFEKLIQKIVRKTILRTLVKEDIDSKGKLDKSPIFFSGYPYDRQKKGIVYYPANLDAAMLIVGFLMLATENYNNILNEEIDLKDRPKTLPDYATTLHNISIYIISVGIEYAHSCIVVVGKEAKGFSCDPTSVVNPKGEIILSDVDRLFFTWTASETINDFRDWNKYLRQLSPPIPVSEISKNINSLIAQLQPNIVWCHDTFFERFKSLRSLQEIEDVAKLISNKEFGNAQLQYGDQLKEHFDHVYHLPQFATIKSISTEELDYQNEIKIIIDKIKFLITKDLENSKILDVKLEDDPDLFFTLTREYELGNIGEKGYKDDAFYPLIVRSISGLLLSHCKRNSTDGRCNEVFDEQFKFLDYLINKMIDMRPTDGDKLWSIAEGVPFILYGTQRTMYALITTYDLLEILDKNLNKTDDIIISEIKQALANSIATNLFNDELISKLKKMGDISRPQFDAKQIYEEPEWAGMVNPEIKQILNNKLVLLAKEIINPITQAFMDDNASEIIGLKTELDNYAKHGSYNKIKTLHSTANNSFRKLCKLVGLPEGGESLNRQSISLALYEYYIDQFLSSKFYFHSSKFESMNKWNKTTPDVDGDPKKNVIDILENIKTIKNNIEK
ncbi:MAG: hypothetical protein ACFFDN_03780 [Candidatus Hodarchaeota archaeon]